MAVLLSDDDVQDHSLPTNIEPRVLRTPLAVVSVSGRPTKGWLRERCRVLPQCPKSHSAPSSPYEDIITNFILNENIIYQNLLSYRMKLVFASGRQVMQKFLPWLSAKRHHQCSLSFVRGYLFSCTKSAKKQ